MLLSIYAHRGQLDYTTSIFGIIGPLLFLYFIVILTIRIVQGQTPYHVYGTWHYLIDDCTHSSQEFYSRIQEIVESKQVPNIRIRTISLFQGALIFSRTRLYLRARWKNNNFDICGMPFGKGFVVSWRCYEKAGFWQVLLTSLPLLGIFFAFLYRKRSTYYRIDTAIAFQTYFHNCVKQAIDELIEEKSLRPFTVHNQTARFTSLT